MRSIRASTRNIQTAFGNRLLLPNFFRIDGTFLANFADCSVYLGRRGTVEHLPPEALSVEEMFEHLRRLAKSHDIVERFRTLWVLALFGERLEQCPDAQIADLLTMVQEHMELFTAEFAVCETARRRLQRSSM